ncbi:hypothetical protein RFI_09570, partial [Reticulomyxa filosa]
AAAASSSSSSSHARKRSGGFKEFVRAITSINLLNKSEVNPNAESKTEHESLPSPSSPQSANTNMNTPTVATETTTAITTTTATTTTAATTANAIKPTHIHSLSNTDSHMQVFPLDRNTVVYAVGDYLHSYEQLVLSTVNRQWHEWFTANKFKQIDKDLLHWQDILKKYFVDEWTEVYHINKGIFYQLTRHERLFFQYCVIYYPKLLQYVHLCPQAKFHQKLY